MEQNPNVGLCYARAERRGENGDLIGKIVNCSVDEKYMTLEELEISLENLNQRLRYEINKSN